MRIGNRAQRRCVGLLSVAVLGIAFSAGAASQTFDEYSGEETYFRFCASCHGEDGRGDGPVSEGLRISVPDLTTLRKRQGDDFPETLLRRIIDGREIVIYHGTRYMPVWGYEFWLEEGADEAAQASVDTIIDNLVDYIESIQR
ncbi:MAG: cytochrome c [Gammaproteobacteria bacterium]|nr:cytochrome c [Gammaproteobacteria bacterium]